MITKEIILENILDAIQEKLPTKRTVIKIENMVIREDIELNKYSRKYEDYYSWSFSKNIRVLTDELFELYILNKYESYSFVLHTSSVYSPIEKADQIYSSHYSNIKMKCKVCGKEDTIVYYDDLNKCKNIEPKYCCRKVKYGRSNAGNAEENFQELKVYFENRTINKGKFILKDRYSIQCGNRHITTIRCVTYSNCKDEVNCWICEEEVEEKYPLFKILKEIGAKYYIKEVRKHSKYELKGNKEFKKLGRLIIYTYNDKTHLTGKIVFNDPLGEEQAKANSNKLVFRWFELKYINDYEYCKIFLNFFFEEIVKRNKLK